jgi:hypothetical protein
LKADLVRLGNQNVKLAIRGTLRAEVHGETTGDSCGRMVDPPSLD